MLGSFHFSIWSHWTWRLKSLRDNFTFPIHNMHAAGTLLVSGNGWILHCKVHAGQLNVWSILFISGLETQFVAKTWSLITMPSVSISWNHDGVVHLSGHVNTLRGFFQLFKAATTNPTCRSFQPPWGVANLRPFFVYPVLLLGATIRNSNKVHWVHMRTHLMNSEAIQISNVAGGGNAKREKRLGMVDLLLIAASFTWN